jgi:anthranilate 1,2-dioxygenase large subunit/terephthalate 1,2-dioxygenase oxygenase component alpha subunit
VSRVPYRVYGDPAVHAAEEERIFRGATWSLVGLELEVPRPGDWRTGYVGETPVVMVRDEGGRVGAFVNRCAHRGNLVCIRKAGRAESGRLTCVYHNWTYDLRGDLKSVAFAKGIGGAGGMPADFDPARHGLRRLRVETIHGLVFATFSDAAPTLADYLGAEMRVNLERVLGRRMCVIGTYSQLMRNDWKLYMENVRDSYHASLLHLFFSTFRLNKLSMEGGIKLSERGWHHISYSIAATDRDEAEYSAGKLRAVNEGFRLADASLLDRWQEYPCGTTLAIQSVFPNFVLQQTGNSIAVRLCLPKGPDRSELHWWLLGAEDDTPEQRRMRVAQSNLVGPGGLISMEDGIVGNWVQRATKGDPGATLLEMGGRTVEPSQGSRATEVSVRGFWQAYRDLMDG